MDGVQRDFSEYIDRGGYKPMTEKTGAVYMDEVVDSRGSGQEKQT